MSTVGKVLVVLISLLTIAWIGLMSMVSRHNANHGELEKKGKDVLASLEKEVDEARLKLAEMENEVEAKHIANDNERTKLRLEYNDLNKQMSELKENYDRISGLLDSLDKANEKTELNYAERNKEVDQAEANIKRTESAVEESRSRNASLLANLERLRTRFVQLSEENKVLARRLSESSFEDVSAGKRALVTGR